MWQHQPKRDPEDIYRFRTYPSKDRYLVSAVPNVIAQTGLYRYSFTENWPVMVGVADLHDCLFAEIPDRPVSKRHVGGTIIRAIEYNPRKLKGVTKNNPKAQQTYCINHAEELRYGLEWMICSWLPTFLWTTVARDEQPEGPEGYAEEMDEIARWTDKEWIENLVDPLLLGEVTLKEPAWDKVVYPGPVRDGAVPKSRLPVDLS